MTTGWSGRRLSASSRPEELSGAAQAGLKLFIGKASCVNCHNGPLFTNNAFHGNQITCFFYDNPQRMNHFRRGRRGQRAFF